MHQNGVRVSNYLNETGILRASPLGAPFWAQNRFWSQLGPNLASKIQFRSQLGPKIARKASDGLFHTPRSYDPVLRLVLFTAPVVAPLSREPANAHPQGKW